MLTRLYDVLFGCLHRRTTWPQTTAKRGTWVTCLECGAEFEYDWIEMRMVAERPRERRPVFQEFRFPNE